MAIELKTQIRNGKMFYIIGSSDLEKAAVVIVGTIAERNALPEVGGFVIVRNPQAGPIKDSTVHRGWAMYVRYTDGNEGVKWIKVAEEESVDGVWGINEELLRQFATRAMLEKFILEQRDKNRRYDAIAEIIDGLREDVNRVLNHPLLNLMDVSNNFPTWKVAIGEGAYKTIYFKDIFIYDNSEDGHLVWKNPANVASEPETVASSFDIAERFLTSGLAFAGETLRVIEVDNSISEFLIVSDGDNLKYKFIGSSANGNVIYVSELPEASSAQVGQGPYYLLPNTLKTPSECGRLYKCVETETDVFEWVSIDREGVNLNLIDDSDPNSNAKIVCCFYESLDSVRIVYRDPPESIIGTGSTRDIYWLRTTIRRKIGSTPTSPQDGTVVFTSNERASNVISFTDHIPNTGVPVYYSVVAETTAHEVYTWKSAQASFPNYSMLTGLIADGEFSKVFSVGDKFTSEYLPGAGCAVQLVVSKISDADENYDDDPTVYLTAIESIGDYVLDGVEYGMKPTTKTSWAGTQFYQAYTDSTGKTQYIQVNEQDFAGTPVANNLFERYGDSLYNPCYDPDNRMCHGQAYELDATNLIRWFTDQDYFVSGVFGPVNECDTDGLHKTERLMNYDGSADSMANVIENVELPSSDNGGITVLSTGTRTKFWIAADDAQRTEQSAAGWEGIVATVADDTPTLGKQAAELKAAVYPVFVLCAHRAQSSSD